MRKFNLLLKFMTMCAVLLMVTICIAANANDSQAIFDNKRSPESEATVKARIEKITAEAAALAEKDGRHWAGAYYHGDGMGVNVMLHIAPDAGFAFEWHGCMGVYDRNWGDVEEQADGSLALTFALPNEQVGFQGLDGRFNVVHWGERIYLIPPDDMINFCSKINQSNEPRSGAHGFFLMRSDDWTKPAAGKPEISEEFKEYLLDEPIEAGLAHADAPTTRPGLGEITFRDTPITLDAGAAAGLRVGMELYTTNLDYFYSAKVTEVGEHTCRATVTQSWGPTSRPEYNPMPEPGHRFSTLPTFARAYRASQ